MMISTKILGTVAIMGGIPCVMTDFTTALARMLMNSQRALCEPGTCLHFDSAPFSDHGPARNHLATRFLGDWLLMLDTDHSFEPDLLIRMMDRMTRYNLDVLTGLYRFKAPPCTPVLYARDPASNLIKPIIEHPKDVVFQVTAAGAGCLLVRRKVFDVIWDTQEQPFDRMDGLSEDHSFFRRIEKLGIKAYCDPRIECHHLRVDTVTRQEGVVDSGELFAVGGYSL